MAEAPFGTFPPDAVAPEAPSDGVSCLAWSPVQDVLAAGSWDQSVRLWEVSQQDQGLQMAHRLTLQHEAPVLSCCFAGNGQGLLTGGCDSSVRLKDLATQKDQQTWQHEAPVKSVFSIEEMNLMVSGSWDKTLRFWSTQQQSPAITLKLPERVYAMDMKYPLLVVGCADRHLLVYNLQNLQANPNPVKQGFTSLKTQTRCISCFTDRQGYIVGSIEGRCSIVHLEDSSQSFQFKCHRRAANASENMPEEYFSVNAVDFHPSHGTFATAGSDGAFIFWDRLHKQRLKDPWFNPSRTPISAAKFNSRGDFFAYAVSYDWSRANEASCINLPNQVMVHSVRDVDIKPKPKLQHPQ